MKYKIKFTRNNKERYWEVKEKLTLTSFAMLLEEVLEKTQETKLNITIEKYKGE